MTHKRLTSYKNYVSKYVHEYEYWKNCISKGEGPTQDFYQSCFTVLFGLSADFYTGKRILDIGCGPMGSLEWADMALERVGLDPLSEAYEFLGTTNQKMSYTPDFCESISFPDEHFDIVSSFNSIDHIDNIESGLEEIARVLRKGGTFLLMTDTHRDPRPCEPQAFTLETLKMFEPFFEMVRLHHFENTLQLGCVAAIAAGVGFDAANPSPRNGALLALFRKPVL